MRKTKILPHQKFGACAIGQSVLRDFGVEGVFPGTVIAFRKDGLEDVYVIQYEDGDVEEFAAAEYTLAYELWLRQSGWVPEDATANVDIKPVTQKKRSKLSVAARDRIEEVMDLTGVSTIAGKHLKGMSDSLKSAVVETAEKNHKKLENNNVKAAVLEVQYAALCHTSFVEHLKHKITPATQMKHGRRKTLIEEQGLLAKIKIGDWILAVEDMSPGMNSEGGYGCVVAGRWKEIEGDLEPILASVDVHWLISNTVERHVKLERLTVVSSPMPCFHLPFKSIMILLHRVRVGSHALQGSPADPTS